MLPHGSVEASHDPAIILLSVIISIAGAYAALYLVERVRSSGGKAWAGWLACAAAVDGTATWSMHYTAKLALNVPLQLDWRIVALSWVVGVAGSAAALLVMGRKEVSWPRAIVGGSLLGGIGISALHFTAMASIRFPHMQHDHSPLLMTLSILLAIVICSFALPLAYRDWHAHPRRRATRHAVALLRGSANPAMHYTAMAAVVFIAAAKPAIVPHAVSIRSLGVIGISVLPITVLIVAVLTSVVDRLQKQRALLDELFEQAPSAVALTTEDDRIIRVNRKFTRTFGYSAAESMGRRLSELIDRPSAPIVISTLRVPVSMPGGEEQIYVILRDITAEKRAEEALRSLPRRLIEMQESTEKQIARELHDEIGQVLTGIGMLLSIPEPAPPATAARLEEARRAVRELGGRVRALALDLRPAALDDFGLIAALEGLLERYTRQTGIAVEFVHAAVEGERFRSEVEVAGYRIVQEALTNIARHAAVSKASVTVEASDGTLHLLIEDEGSGFDVSAVHTGAGLGGMRERVTILGGEMEIVSAPGSGTRVWAELPLETDS
jgi:signal transduction histidine kinase